MSKKSNEVMYRQCNLSRRTSDTLSVTTTWLPEKFAIMGKYLKLMNGEGEFVNGWQVDSVSDVARDGRYLNTQSQTYKKTRKASDI